MATSLSDLNPQQRRAVVLNDGPLLVLAGPGSGKTRVITRRIAYRVAVGELRPDRLLAITFTNRAAREMGDRVKTLLDSGSDLAIGTFHWAMHGLLRRHIHHLDRRRDFRLLTAVEARRALRLALGGTGHQDRAADIAAAISAIKNGSSFRSEAQRFRLPTDALRHYLEAYDGELRAQNALDLDDLLHKAALLLRTVPDVAARCRAAYDEILVDEYQDTNPVQRELLRAILPDTRSIVAVGDEDQAIYGWRQADYAALLEFTDDFPGATIVKLEETYRSSKHILRAATSLISHNSHRFDKSLRTIRSAGERPVCFVARDETEEAEWIAAEIDRDRRSRGRDWHDYAVLYRVNAQSRAIEDAFLRLGVPYHIYAGRRFYERPEIRRTVAYLRLVLDDGDDDALVELLSSVRGVGEKRMALLRQRADAASLLGTLDPPALVLLPAGVRRRVASLLASIHQLRAARTANLDRLLELVEGIVAGELEEASPSEREAALENLGELRTIAAEMASGRVGLRDFLSRFAMADAGDQRSDGVRLMTLHAAKGLEFPVVFLPGLEEGLLPHRRALASDAEIEEERRLCYVGMTRAQDALFLSFAHARVLSGQAQVGHSSRFLPEMGVNNITTRISPRACSRPRLASVGVGERVRHARWGCGSVLAIEGMGRNTMVTISFDSGTRRRVQLCHAPLVRVSEETDHVLAG